jgi:hypothetical protein
VHEHGPATLKGAVRPALVAGAAAGIAGLLVFLALHALWIVPIWFILPAGLPFALVSGAAMSWAYAELHPALPGRPWTVLAVMGLVAATLLPAITLAELRPALFVETPAGAIPTKPIPILVARFVGELLPTATIVGVLAGWRLGRTRRATAAMALASFLFALGPGHNIPFIAGTPGVGTVLALLVPVIAASALVLVESHAWLMASELLYTDRTHGVASTGPHMTSIVGKQEEQ